MAELEHFAGAVSAVVARLRAAVARGVAVSNDEFLHEWELTDAAAGILVHLRHTLPDRLATWTGVAAVHVYDAPSTVMRGVDDLVERGLVETTVDGAFLTTKGREALHALHSITGKVTDELWGENTAICEALLPLLRTVVTAAAETGGEAFGLLYPPYEHEGSSATVMVAGLLEPIHYHRFDAQVSAWRTAGLTPHEAQLLTGGTLWRVLQEDTNLRDAAPYSALKPRQRLDLLSGLGSLPG
ncbi:MAG TPA: hypothetical protein VLI04_18425 [Nocardioidaceae bacterium]|nr:hypothetical protein [Nocardioidaceae bacterium]